jgi:hypothetical protein
MQALLGVSLRRKITFIIFSNAMVPLRSNVFMSIVVD